MVSEQLKAITAKVKKEFGGLTEMQLNLRPAGNKWSIAQCLDHLIISNDTYTPSFNALLDDTYQHTLWQKMNPLTTFTGRKLKEMLKSENNKMKAPAIFNPSVHDLPVNIIMNFEAHQEKLGHTFDRLEQMKLGNKIISSPVAGAVTLKVCDIMEIIAVHEQRHIRQAMGVKGQVA